jgi:hypothetical protein
VEAKRAEDRSIAWTWAMRGTLHLLAAEDTGWLLALLGPKFIAGGKRRLAQLGWDEGRTAAGLRLLEAALGERGGLTRSEIAQVFKQEGLPSEGQAPFHLIYRAAREGRLCYGPEQEGSPRSCCRRAGCRNLSPSPAPRRWPASPAATWAVTPRQDPRTWRTGLD